MALKAISRMMKVSGRVSRRDLSSPVEMSSLMSSLMNAADDVDRQLRVRHASRVDDRPDRFEEHADAVTISGHPGDEPDGRPVGRGEAGSRWYLERIEQLVEGWRGTAVDLDLSVAELRDQVADGRLEGGSSAAPGPPSMTTTSCS
jgi:hypothetical protein